ncbi:class I SAM-dependent methyltransferase [Roseospirillum parvum]|uniref:Methyltransferase domain-containing protein n=1 Tax=Roseospirillum parvum TaxID=83401 RepID=A0A1G7TUH3_9PROT|nr:methyltransferase domain-containing protein [Roseospirillum parvum]SDG38898.1 Methyltransferase domain-containing protein [Roseospirillum parvum]
MSGDRIWQGTACRVCGTETEPVLDLPRFPLTGIFVAEPRPADVWDQGYRVCPACGHGQLTGFLDPELMYDPAYAHRSSASHLAPPAARFVAERIAGWLGGRRPRLALEIGCNDLVLMGLIAPMVERAVGVDPVWRHGAPTDPPANVEVIPGMIEELDPAALPGAPDLVYSTHNLEHLADPVGVIAGLLELAAEDALFVIEVPDAATMIRHGRFDQVFHQHFHYFTLASLRRMVAEAGGRWLGHAVNPRNWGGSVTIAFRRGPGGGKGAAQEPVAPPPTPDETRRAVAAFKARMAALAELLAAPAELPLIGYGAGQMVPTLAWHLDSDLAMLAAIHDDNPARAGLRYPGLAPSIRPTSELPDLAAARVLVTAPDGARPITAKLAGAAHVLLPTCVV